MSRSLFTSPLTSHSVTRRQIIAIAGVSAPAVLVAPALAQRVFAQATPEAANGSNAIAEGIVTTDLGAFFDPSLVHEIGVTFDQDEYDAMIDAYSSTGEKGWLEATVTINGETFAQSGMRLKGNSSLGGLREGGPDGMMPQNDVAPDGQAATAATPAGASAGGETATPEAGAIRRDGPGDMVVVAGGGGASADQPEKLPWLVKLDEFAQDQAYQGLSQFVVRANGTPTALNESLALRLLTEAGLASQLAAYTAFSVNESDPVVRLAIENPKTTWMKAHFSGDGLLWKAEAGGNWEYRGDDPAEYVDVFDLEAGDWGGEEKNVAPLASFLDFINSTDDDTFAGQLPDRLDVDQFTTYLAMMDLIQNFDDISGPGNNAYLYIAPETNRVTIVPWDMNLAFQEGFDGAQPTMVFGTNPEGTPVVPATGGESGGNGGPTFVINGTPVAGGDIPEEAMPTRPDGEAHAIGGMNNPLPTRFKENTDYAGQIAERKTALQQQLYAGGIASDILTEWATVLQDHARGLVSAKDLASDVERLRTIITGA